jgi:peptide/nickel transport system permease protein
MIILPAILGALTLIFLSIHLIPWDPVDLLVMPGSPEAEFDLMRHNLGLDKPIYVQYFIFFRNLLTGDFGKSIYSRRPVLEEISKCYLATFQLTICAMTVAIIVGLTTGIVAASKKGTIWDHSLRLVAFFGISVPPFWLALILTLVVSVNLRLLPVSGVGSFRHLILPSITLGAYTAAMTSRFTYGSLLEVMNQDYIRTAKMKGCGEIRVLFLHAQKML